MDLEAELIRSSNWGELKRLYSGRLGHSWELAWIHLLRFRDPEAAVQEFKKCLRDPNFEQASFIMLWKLGHPSTKKIVLESHSLRLYIAYQNIEVRPLAYWLSSDSAHQVYAFQILDRLLKSNTTISADDLELIGKDISPKLELSFLLGRLWEKKQKDLERAEAFYNQFYTDVLVKKVSTESRRILFDPEMSDRIRFAYASRDGLLLRRLHKALHAKLEKVRADIPATYFQAFSKALDIESESLTENLLGFQFWKKSEWSPRASFEILQTIFNPGEMPMPQFVYDWDRFFNQKELSPPPMQLDGDCLPLWQIRVELQPDLISEALLRYPAEERFLFLWSVRNFSKSEKDKRQWPSEEQESETVRKNLERAFERSSNKVLWFDRLRSCGCSQNFYEHALSKIQIPMEWVLEDLKKNFIQNTAAVRQYLKDNLRIVAPNDSGSHLLSNKDLLSALAWLTPAEKQEVLLSRFVLVNIPSEILSDEILDLLWDARDQVSGEIFQGWRVAVLDYLQSFNMMALSPQKWLWIESAWSEDVKSLERFSPGFGRVPESFPWDSYLRSAFHHQAFNLILAALPSLSDERLKLEWVEQLMTLESLNNLKSAIQSLKDPAAKSRLMAQFFYGKSDFVGAARSALDWLENSAILNEQAEAAKFYIQTYESMQATERKERLGELRVSMESLKSLGVVDFNVSLRVAKILEQDAQWELGWQYFIEAWWITSDQIKLQYFDRMLEFAIHSRKMEDAQRLLVQLLFMRTGVDPLQKKILDSLLDENSPLRLRHVRQEFVSRASRIDPLHPEILKRRASFDYRASLLWDCFYGTEIPNAIVSQAPLRKRQYELWGLTEVMMRSNSLKHFTKYLDFYDDSELASEAHDFLDSAKRILSRLAKQFKIKEKIKIRIKAEMSQPLRFCFLKPRIEVTKSFFEDLDENMWAGICVGYFQMLQDRTRGLYDEVSLMERFFQGSLLSGTPIASVIRLLVWLSIQERIVEPRVMQFRPQELIQNLPLLNHLLIFYLGEDFKRKVEDCGIQLL